MNLLLQISVLTVLMAVALCVPHVPDHPKLQLIRKLHKLHQAGLVSSDAVQDACSDAAEAKDVCEFAPAAPVCLGVAVACGAYGLGSFLKDHFG